MHFNLSFSSLISEVYTGNSYIFEYIHICIYIDAYHNTHTEDQ